MTVGPSSPGVGRKAQIARWLPLAIVGVILLIVAQGGSVVASAARATADRVGVAPSVTIGLPGGWQVIERSPEEQVVVLESGPCRLYSDGAAGTPRELFLQYVEQVLPSQLAPFRVTAGEPFSTGSAQIGIRGYYEGIGDGIHFAGEVSAVRASGGTAVVFDGYTAYPAFSKCVRDTRQMIEGMRVGS